MSEEISVNSCSRSKWVDRVMKCMHGGVKTIESSSRDEMEEESNGRRKMSLSSESLIKVIYRIIFKVVNNHSLYITYMLIMAITSIQS